MSSISAYALCAPTYWERGWLVIPTMPAEKRPGEYRRGQWIGMPDWNERYRDRSVSKFEMRIWCGAPGNAGIGLVCGRADGVVGIDLDTDDPKIRRAIVSVVPASTFRKRGETGETLFYRGAGIESKSYNGAHGRILDVLSDNRFCVLPPSPHPSGCLYAWTGPDTFADCSPADLPEITVEHIAVIGEALRPFGWQARPERPARTSESRSDAGWWGRVNDLALAAPEKWVPQLELFNLRRTRDGFQAVATWRASSTGRPVEQRKRNLGISCRGIRDFGDGRGYSPIDLVMAASDCDFGDALEWLAERVDPPTVIIALEPRMKSRIKEDMR
jgi:hypothetical protein